jgi:hypothetical protein
MPDAPRHTTTTAVGADSPFFAGAAEHFLFFNFNFLTQCINQAAIQDS